MHPVVTWSKHTVFAIATQLGALWLYLPLLRELAVHAAKKCPILILGKAAAV